MTEQEITQARADLAQLDAEQLRFGVMLQLLKILELTKERDALAADAERYRWLRRSATKLSFDNALISSLVRDQAELDAAIKEAGVQ